MKKYFVVAYILLITAACSLPFVGMICGWGAKSTENRTMTGLPDLYTAEEDRIDPNLNYTAELGEYYSDNFGFRQELVTAHSWLNETVFGRSSNEKTVVGKRGWYYLSETIDDYTGVSALSDRGIYRLQKTLDLMNEFSEEGNITFVFFVVPNKNSIYPEYMPDSIMASEKPSNLDRLNKAMRARLYFLDVKSVLVKSAKDRTRYIYLKNDSHWNNIGALAAYNALQENLNLRIEKYDYMPIDESKLYISQTEISGDLTTMLYPSLTKTDIQYELGLPKNFSSNKPLRDQHDLSGKVLQYHLLPGLLLQRVYTHQFQCLCQGAVYPHGEDVALRSERGEDRGLQHCGGGDRREKPAQRALFRAHHGRPAGGKPRRDAAALCGTALFLRG